MVSCQASPMAQNGRSRISFPLTWRQSSEHTIPPPLICQPCFSNSSVDSPAASREDQVYEDPKQATPKSYAGNLAVDREQSQQPPSNKPAEEAGTDPHTRKRQPRGPLKRSHSPPSARGAPPDSTFTPSIQDTRRPVPSCVMTEPPAKRAKRTDSSAMWDRNSPGPRDDSGREPRGGRHNEREGANRGGRRDVVKDTRDDARSRLDAPRREGRERDHGRDTERRHRSRSRDRRDRRQDRSRSRDGRGPRHKDEQRRDRSQDRDRHRDGDGRDRRDRERDRSRDRHRTRRGNFTLASSARKSFQAIANKCFNIGEPVSRRSERPQTHSRSRSRSPIREKTTGARTRSPLRPSKPNGAKPSTPDPDAKNVIPSANPPSGPRSQKPVPTAPKASTTAPVSKTNGAPPTTGPSVAASKPSSTSAGSKASDAMDVDEDPETAELRKMMGFAGFRTTKQTKVPGNNVYGVRKEKKTEYRQYMNRIGGFNRPLSPSR